MTPLDDADSYESEDDLGIGRPGSRDPALMTARQLLAACQEARGADDRAYAAAETEAFLESAGQDVDDAVLLELLALPADAALMQALSDLADALARRAPSVVPAVYAIAHGRAPVARANAAMVLNRLRRSDLAAGVVLVLQDTAAGQKLKESAAESLLALVRSAPAVVFDALAEPDVRAWLVRISGCPPQLSDAELMRRLVAVTASRTS